jgi:hypothetical protein
VQGCVGSPVRVEAVAAGYVQWGLVAVVQRLVRQVIIPGASSRASYIILGVQGGPAEGIRPG